MIKFLRKLLGTTTQIVFPQRCPYCRNLVEETEYACKNCRKDMPQDGIYQGVLGGYRCASRLPYQGRYKRAVLNFKFNGKKQHKTQFAQILYEEVSRYYEDMVFDCVTFVPMHKKALKKRGYNQCKLLAQELSKLMGIPCVKVIEKVKNTDPQHELTAKKRKTNLKGAFKIIDKSQIKGKTILIIDDIITTGSTLSECAKTINKAKPQMICCLTLLSVTEK